MKVLVTGVGGQLGYDVMKSLEIRKIEAIGVDKKDFDITDFASTEAFILNYIPDVIIHCSAYTAVDKAEDQPEACRCVNFEGTKNIAGVCKKINAKMVYISTDYVFSGMGENFFEVDDDKLPLNIYGLTKYEGEQIVQGVLEKYFIVRASWVFGKNGNNFVKTMLRIGKENNEVNVVCDQIGSPTYTIDLANLICDMIITEKYGVYHASNEGICSWAEFAKEIFSLSGYVTNVTCIRSDQFPAKATRPLNSRLSKASLDNAGFKRLPDWKDALKIYLKEIE